MAVAHIWSFGANATVRDYSSLSVRRPPRRAAVSILCLRELTQNGNDVTRRSDVWVADHLDSSKCGVPLVGEKCAHQPLRLALSLGEPARQQHVATTGRVELLT